MKAKSGLLMLIAIISTTFIVFADSPLTSTTFSSAYQNEEIVIKASKTNGLLTKELMKYLLKKNNPIVVKMALINELSWDIDGKSNTVIFMNYLKKKKIYKNEGDFLEDATGDIILCLAYLKALDDYNQVNDALAYAEHALKKNRKSYTYNIITALIKAQKAFDTDWCEVFILTDNVRKDNSLTIDMNNNAISIIFDYMDLYEGDCG